MFRSSLTSLLPLFGMIFFLEYIYHNAFFKDLVSAPAFCTNESPIHFCFSCFSFIHKKNTCMCCHVTRNSSDYSSANRWVLKFKNLYTLMISGCQACTLDSVQQIMISLGTKAFTSDTIDNSGTCAIRTSVCNGFSAGSGVLISVSIFALLLKQCWTPWLQYNRDAAGVDDGTDTVTSTLVCNDAGQWTKTQNGVTAVITAFECQSTP